MPTQSGNADTPPTSGGHLSPPMAKLIIEEPRVSDDALYKCDVTYVRGKCPSISLVRVQMLSLPEKAQIVVPASTGSATPVLDGQLIGPYNENEQLKLSCLVFGGRPAPKSIVWRKIDASGRTVNLLQLSGNQVAAAAPNHQPVEVLLNHTLSSSDLGARFECHIEHEAMEMRRPQARVLDTLPRQPAGRRQDSESSGGGGDDDELTAGESASSGDERRKLNPLDSHVFVDLNVGVASLDLLASRVNKLTHQVTGGSQQQQPHLALPASEQQQPFAGSQVFREGELVELECVAYNSRPPANISWFNGNELISADSTSSQASGSGSASSLSQLNGGKLRHKRLLQRQQVHQNQDGQTFNTHAFLSIKLSRHEHKAQITCQAQNKPMVSPLSKSLELQVQHAPIVMMEPAAGVTMNEAAADSKLDSTVIAQQDVSIYCIYQANPSDFLANSTRWFRDGQLLSVERSSSVASELPTSKRSASGRLFESTTATGYPVLTIRQVNRRDAGLYECQLANAVGTSERLASSDAFKLEVNFRPAVQLRLYKLIAETQTTSGYAGGNASIVARPSRYNMNELLEVDLSQELVLAGNSFVFVCEVLEAQPQKILKFSWFKTSSGSNGNPKRQLMAQSDEDQLELPALSSDFRPTQFACSAQNSLGASELSQQIELQLSYTPGPSLVALVKDAATRRQILATGRPASSGNLDSAEEGVASGTRTRRILTQAAGAELMLECVTRDLGQPRANVWLWLRDGKSIDVPPPTGSSGGEPRRTSGHANPIEILSGQQQQQQRRGNRQAEETEPTTIGGDNNDSDRQLQQEQQQQQQAKLVASGRYLFVPAIQLAHKGNYSCVALNRLGSGSAPAQEATASGLALAVALAPSLVQPLGQRTHWPEVSDSSSELELSCRVQCDPLCQLDWLRNNDRLADSQFVTYKVEHSLLDELPASNQFKGVESKLTLRFQPLDSLASGPNLRDKLRERRHFLGNSNFTCQSSANAMGPPVKSTTKFIVQYPPEGVQINTPLQPGDKSTIGLSGAHSAAAPLLVVEGSNGPKLSCEATGEPRVQFRWLLVEQLERQTGTETGTGASMMATGNSKAPVELSNLASESVGVAQGNSISFLDLSNQVIERRQSGYYVCEASNRLGVRRAAIYVDVLYKPSCATLHLHSLDVTVAPSAASNGNGSQVVGGIPRPLKATSQDEYSLAVRETSEDFIGLRKMLVVAPLARGAKLLASGANQQTGGPLQDSFSSSIFASILDEKSQHHQAKDLVSLDVGGQHSEFANLVDSSGPASSWQRFSSLLLKFLNNYQRQVKSQEEAEAAAEKTRGNKLQANRSAQRDKRQHRRQSALADDHQVNRIDAEDDPATPMETKNLITFACLARDGNPMQNLTFDWSFGSTRLPETHAVGASDSASATSTTNHDDDDDHLRPALIYTNENQTLSVELIRRLDTKTSLSPFQLSLLTLDVIVASPDSSARVSPLKTRSSYYRVARQTVGGSSSSPPRPIGAPVARNGRLRMQPEIMAEQLTGGRVSVGSSIELSADNWQEQLGQLLRCSVSNQVGQSDFCPAQVNLLERARQREAAAASSSSLEFAKWRFVPSLASKSLLILSVLIACSLVLFVTLTLLLTPYLKSLQLAREFASNLQEHRHGAAGKADSTGTGTQSTSSQKSSVLGLLGNGDSSLQGSSSTSSDDDVSSQAKMNGHLMRHSLQGDRSNQLANDAMIISASHQNRAFQRQDPMRLSHQMMTTTATQSPYDRPRDRFAHQVDGSRERPIDAADSTSLRATITTGSRLLSNLRSLSKFRTSSHNQNHHHHHHQQLDRVGDFGKSLHLKTVSSSETNTTGFSGLDACDLNGLVSPAPPHSTAQLDSPLSSSFLNRPSSVRQSHLGFSRNNTTRPQSYYHMYNGQANDQQATYSNMMDYQQRDGGQQQKPYDAMDEFMRQRGIDTSFEGQFYADQYNNHHHYQQQQQQQQQHYQRPPPPPSKPPLHPRQQQLVSNSASLYRAGNGSKLAQSRPQVAARSVHNQESAGQYIGQTSTTMDNRFSMPSYLSNATANAVAAHQSQVPLPTVSGGHYFQANTIDSHLNRMAIDRVAYQASGLTYANANFATSHYDDTTATHLQDLSQSSASEHIYDLNAYATPEQTPARRMANLNYSNQLANLNAQSTDDSERPRVSQLIQSFDHHQTEGHQEI